MARDRFLLERFYIERGYGDYRLISAQGAIASDRSGFVVTFAIDEGRNTELGKSRLSDIEGLEPA